MATARGQRSRAVVPVVLMSGHGVRKSADSGIETPSQRIVRIEDSVASSEDPALVRCTTLAALGIVLMFVAHALGLLGWVASEGHDARPFYWWAYLILYPGAGAGAVHLSSAKWVETAVCLCSPPILYFLGLGFVDGNWLASDGAIVGSITAFGVTALVARLVQGSAAAD